MVGKKRRLNEAVEKINPEVVKPPWNYFFGGCPGNKPNITPCFFRGHDNHCMFTFIVLLSENLSIPCSTSYRNRGIDLVGLGEYSMNVAAYCENMTAFRAIKFLGPFKWIPI
jgi:hypothetical protein